MYEIYLNKDERLGMLSQNQDTLHVQVQYPWRNFSLILFRLISHTKLNDIYNETDNYP